MYQPAIGLFIIKFHRRKIRHMAVSKYHGHIGICNPFHSSFVTASTKKNKAIHLVIQKTLHRTFQKFTVSHGAADQNIIILFSRFFQYSFDTSGIKFTGDICHGNPNEMRLLMAQRTSQKIGRIVKLLDRCPYSFSSCL